MSITELMSRKDRADLADPRKIFTFSIIAFYYRNDLCNHKDHIIITELILTKLRNIYEIIFYYFNDPCNHEDLHPLMLSIKRVFTYLLHTIH